MSVASGPNIVTSGLVVDYNVNNPRSFVGPPLTNSQWNNASEVTPWTVGGVNTDVTGTSNQGPVANAKTWKFVKTGTSNQWNGWESNYGGIWTGSAGDVWTTSYWYKTSAPAGNTGFGIGSFYTADWARGYSTTILANRSTIIADGTWRWNYTVTQINEAYTNAIIVDGPSWGYSTQSGELYINGLQWNKNNYAGAYAAGTRSSTQSLLSATLGSTITVNSLAYSYDGSNFTFNGSNSYIDSGTNIPNTSAFTLACMVRPATSQVQYAGIMGNHGGSFAGVYCQQQSTSTNNYVWGHGNGSSWGTGCTFSLTGNAWSYVVLVKDSSFNYVYINGSLANSVATNGTAALGPFNLCFGRDYDTARYFNGSIEAGQVYNKALSAQEVSQNFNALRGRYGI